MNTTVATTTDIFVRTPWNSRVNPQRTAKTVGSQESRIALICRRGSLPGSLKYTAHLLMGTVYYEKCQRANDVPPLPVLLSFYKKSGYVDISIAAHVLPRAEFISMEKYRKDVAMRVKRLRSSANILRDIITGKSTLDDHPFLLFRDPTYYHEDEA